MKIAKPILAASLLLSSALPPMAQRRDALTDAESDQLREVAQEPLQRLPMIVKFARVRLDKLDYVRADPAEEEKNKKIHDLLDDFRSLIDELDDNIDDYNSRRLDLRKPLKLVVEGETEFQNRLRAFKEATAKDETSAAREYGFALQDAIEAVNLSVEDARKLLAEQTELMKAKEKREKEKEKAR
ncbi:MAG TPA: hypothetical protein VEG30_12650 [Terriglobales bacterium]|nr:hypothetical protein [Terriglobales bacterium]